MICEGEKKKIEFSPRRWWWEKVKELITYEVGGGINQSTNSQRVKNFPSSIMPQREKTLEEEKKFPSLASILVYLPSCQLTQ